MARDLEVARSYRLAVHPETGMLLQINGVAPKYFTGGDISTTAQLREATVSEEATGKRPLSAFEQHELSIVRDRVTAIRWDLPLSAGTLTALLLWAILAIDVNGGVSVYASALAGLVGGTVAIGLLAGVWSYQRSTRAKLRRDSQDGLVRLDTRWMLPESGICWQEDGHPGALRLTKGGLGSEADGTSRPMSF